MPKKRKSLEHADKSYDHETHLLLRARDGDKKAFEEFHDALEKVVRDFTISRADSLGPQDRDDIVQEVFTRLSEQLHNFRGDSLARTYVLSITKNVVRQKLSEQSKFCKLHVQNTDILSNYPDPQTLPHCCKSDPTELLNAVEQAKAQLTDKRRQAFALVCQEGLAVPDAAKLAGCSYKTFRRRLDLARRKIQEALEGLE